MDEYDFYHTDDSNKFNEVENIKQNDDYLDDMKNNIECNITDDNFDEICDDYAFIQHYTNF